MKRSLSWLMKKAEREGISMQELARRGGRRSATLRKKRYISKPKPINAFWDK